VKGREGVCEGGLVSSEWEMDGKGSIIVHNVAGGLEVVGGDSNKDTCKNSVITHIGHIFGKYLIIVVREICSQCLIE